MSNSTFDFNAFIQESKDVLVKPKTYFSTMKTTGGIAEPLIKAVIYGVVAGIIAFIWSLLKLGFVTGGIFGGAAGIMLFVYYLIVAIVGLFVGSVILLIISAICKGSTDFEASVRVVAAVMVVMPIAALLGFVTGLNITAGTIVGLAVNIFALYLLYHGLVQALKAKPETTKIVIYILIALLVIFMLLGIRGKRQLTKITDEYNEELKELRKD
jgi:hypothetical protein